MVAVMLDEARTDRILHALSDATRRDILTRSLVGPHSVSSLARNYAMSLAAVQKHVAVLESAGLVTKERHGRESRVTGQIDSVRAARRLLDHYEDVWRDRLDRFGEVLATIPAEPLQEGNA
ncbi:MAG: helix-turn-helix domain-containing protein [Actinomycetota bacterium]|nr:helix-turn-helix domain-containing protein [Actinomycetota bacterium]